MKAKTTFTLCLVGAVGSLMIGFGSLGWSLMSADDSLIFPLVSGPYAMIACLTWWRRSSSSELKVLPGTLILVMTFGLWGLCFSAYRRFSTVHDEVAMDLTPLLVPVVQCLFISLIGIFLGVVAVARSLRRSAS